MVEARRRVVRHPVAHKAFCAKIRNLRTCWGYTQEFVAEELNISRSQYTALESGRSMINFDQLRCLSVLYSTTLSGLLSGVD